MRNYYYDGSVYGPMTYESSLQDSIPGKLIRGGTSRGLFVQKGLLPETEPERSNRILELFGSPDPLQLDGVGGSHSHTSKIIMVGNSSKDEIDIEYTFGQVGIETESVDFGGNCGNLTSTVGVFAILENLTEATEPSTELQLYNTNTDTIISQSIPVRQGEPVVEGDFEIDGIPVSGARIESKFHEPGGGVTGSLLPTESVKETVEVGGTDIPVSIVDSANPNVFVHADDVGMEGAELPTEIESDPDLLSRLERIRSVACARIGLVESADDATEQSPGVPYVAVVSSPQSYDGTNSTRVDSEQIDITARIMSNQAPHHAYAMTGAMCLASAVNVSNSVPAEVASHAEGEVRIGHPKGTVTIGVQVSTEAESVNIDWVSVDRHARLLMDGDVYYRNKQF